MKTAVERVITSLMLFGILGLFGIGVYAWGETFGDNAQISTVKEGLTNVRGGRVTREETEQVVKVLRQSVRAYGALAGWYSAAIDSAIASGDRARIERARDNAAAVLTEAREAQLTLAHWEMILSEQ